MRLRWVTAMVLGLGALAPGAAATQETPPLIPGLAEWADGVVVDGIWNGQRIAYPEITERPTSSAATRSSLLFPVSVHAEAGVSAARLDAALAALEFAFEALSDHGWPLPVADGGRDGTDGFDLHLRSAWSTKDPVSWVPTERAPPERFSRAGLDAPNVLSDVDGALTFAELYAGVPDDRLEACVVSALVEASLLGADPAEAPALRRATAVFLSWTWTGHFGCDDERVIEQQREPTRGWLGHDPSSGEGGALFLASLSARHDGGSGDWLRDVWNASRQRTREGELHGIPDVPWMLVQATELTRTLFTRSVVDFAASRWFSGTRRSAARLPVLRALPDEATPVEWISTTWARLPRRLLFGEREVEPYGTAYARVDVRGAPPGSRLVVWMQGEYGVEWSMVGMRVGADGREISRTRAPARDRDPRGYLAFELLEDTREVVIAVTNLSGRGPDADEPDDHGRSFRLTVDRAAD